jgi:hypothetical protein
MTRVGRIAALGSLLALTPVPASASTDVPPPGSVSVVLRSPTGSGCRPETVMIDNNVELFKVYYSGYSVSVGQGQPPLAFRKNCQISVMVTHPPEYTYGIIKVEHSGYADIKEGASGTLRSSFSIFGQKPPVGMEHVIRGPYTDDWRFTEQSDLPGVPVKPCGDPGITTLATDLRVNAGTSDKSEVSFMSMESVDSSLSSTYHFYWRPC